MPENSEYKRAEGGFHHRVDGHSNEEQFYPIAELWQTYCYCHAPVESLIEFRISLCLIFKLQMKQAQEKKKKRKDFGGTFVNTEGP